MAVAIFLNKNNKFLRLRRGRPVASWYQVTDVWTTHGDMFGSVVKFVSFLHWWVWARRTGGAELSALKKNLRLGSDANWPEQDCMVTSSWITSLCAVLESNSYHLQNQFQFLSTESHILVSAQDTFCAGEQKESTSDTPWPHTCPFPMFFSHSYWSCRRHTYTLVSTGTNVHVWGASTTF